MKKRLLIVGHGMVSQHFIEQFLATPTASEWQIQVFGEERHAAYDRVHLSEYFAKGATALLMADPDFHTLNNVQLHLEEAVLALDPAKKTLRTHRGEYRYDQLVLATGSYPFVPPIVGRDLPHCFVYRTLDDLDAIRQSAATASHGVVIGGGLLGLEAANALQNLGLQASVVEFAPRLMPVQLDTAAGTLLRDKIEALGVAVHTEKATQEIRTGEERRLRLCFNDNTWLETDLIVFSAGIRPQDALARQAGLQLGERGGIAVDEHCLTSDPAIYAIGECAVWQNRHFGLVAPGYAMARAAVSSITQQGKAVFQGADMSTKLKLLGVDVGSIGDAHGSSDGARNYQYHNEIQGSYARLVVDETGKRLLGAILVGDNSPYDLLLQYHLNSLPLPDNPVSLLLPVDAAGAPALSMDSLPDTASICSCHNVTKGDIREAMNDGATNIAEVKAVTRAATNCGGCASMLKSVVEAELESRGVVVDRSLCEHFAFTRQDLFHQVRVEGIRTFEALLHRHGKGGGCEICKPAVASILASCWNEHVLEPAHVALQDTNDTFMANMQKNGTYSVVPRIPGGEITPDMLLAIGQVGKKYSLYTKITGGQRIDLFGATLDELPLIWEELIAAGFETGHAYGKSLRTVKSCVGSTWCRYGVQDSVAMAIFLENRYKGLRSPHKIKMAVSGCTRECAEAQSKDIGVIATEKGWNLYVCGNGGMRPRHADLFARDLDDAGLVQAIDRVLMFYVRTADRLQRTSVWLENLDGGLDYLKQVVLEDSLNIGAELETQMQQVVDTYQCEWKTAINDPQKRKRFRSYVNADEPRRARIQLIEERGQLIPARNLAEEVTS